MSVHIVGNIPEITRAAIEMAIRRTGTGTEFHDCPSKFMRAVRHSAQSPTCVVASTPDLATLIDWIRDEGHLFHVPVISLAAYPTQSAFREGLDMGADDVVLMYDLPGLTRRVGAVADNDAAGRPPAIRKAVICDVDERRRRLSGRTLRHAGFDLTFACTLGEAAATIEGEKADLLVLSESCTEGNVHRAVSGLRTVAGGADIPVLISGTPGSTARRVASELARTAFLADGSPSSHLLFQVNELMTSAPARELRTTPRLLLSVFCSFREAGSLNPSYGLTYNVSREGMFIRTLDPLPKDRPAWIEVRLADSEPAVHMRGTVVWVCHANPAKPSPTPPGFGVRLDLAQSPRQDMRRYVRAYDRLREEQDRQRTRRPTLETQRPSVRPSMPV